MPDLPRAAVRYYLVKNGDFYSIVDTKSPCRKKIGRFPLDEATKLVEEMNAAWRAATTPTKE